MTLMTTGANRMMNSGITKTNVGNSIFTGIWFAISSARSRRVARTDSDWARSAGPTLPPRRSVWRRSKPSTRTTGRERSAT